MKNREIAGTRSKYRYGRTSFSVGRGVFRRSVVDGLMLGIQFSRGEPVNELEQAFFFPSFEEGREPLLSKCLATLYRAQRGRSDASLQQAFDLPGRAEIKVT